LPRLGQKHQVTVLGFNRDIWELKPEQLEELFKKASAPDTEGAVNAGAYTDLRLPLVKAQELTTGDDRDLIGVILLTDGQHNSGEPPVKKALELGERKIPIYPVALGSRLPPPDIAVVAVKAPHNVFK